MSIGRCGIYANRPQRCREYPVWGDYLPEGCTYYFEEGQRRGECRPDVCLQDNCCAMPRVGGDPLGKSCDALAGGLPCKHLVWVESVAVEKTASAEEVHSNPSDLYEAVLGDILR